MSKPITIVKPAPTAQKMRFSVVDYQRMGKAGVFEDKPKVELIDGEIYTMSPITPDHNGHVDKAAYFFNKVLVDKVIVRTQGSIRTDDYSEPEPDIAILRFDKNFYSKEQATAADTLLVIEVAVFSVDRDRTIKKRKYAMAGIPEYWIIIPHKKIIEVYRQPEEEDYAQKVTYKLEDNWVFETFDLKINGRDLLIP